MSLTVSYDSYQNTKLDLYFINTQVFLLITQQRQIHVLIRRHSALNNKVTECTMVNKFRVGQNVLLAKREGNKMSSVFENKLYKVIRQKGSNHDNLIESYTILLSSFFFQL
jgi:hypothetical protein